MINVILYMRDDCHLCKVAEEQLNELQTVVPHALTSINVDSDPKLRSQFGFNVPVVLVGPYKITAPIDKKDLEISLRAVQHSQEQEEKLTQAINAGQVQLPVTWTKADGFTLWLSKHYLAIFNILVFIYVGLPFLAPVLMKAGADKPASVIYKAYSFVCHQFAFRSWFLFGEQPAYPRAEAHTNFVSYQVATGLDGADLLTARGFVGNDVVGYKVALCQRDVAIYGGILIFGLLFAAANRKIKSIHWVIWILIGVAPIALDGFSQLLSQLPLGLIPFRESTPLLRTLTGFLFGFMTAWFGYPYVEESMAENFRFMKDKLSRVENSTNTT